MFRVRSVAALLALGLAWSAAAHAQSAPHGPQVGGRTIFGPPPPVAPAVQTRDEATSLSTVRAIKLTSPLTFDGTLDEAVYKDTESITGFFQVLPKAGEPSTEKTEVWILFDKDNVYVSARLWVKDMKTLIANELRHDKARQNDDFGVALDTFYDRQTGYLFYTNPLGAVGDCQVGEATGATNCDYNPVWDVRAGRFDHGWTVEMKVPFKSLRYRPGAEQVWGINLRRTIRYRNETTFLTKLPITAGGGGIGRLSYAGTLVGVEAPGGARNLDIKPYGIARMTSDNTVKPATSNDGTGDFGVDVKYGVTQNLSADFTYNTDFAQVEADDQQVNLTRFNQSFPEKRDFFLESAGIFSASGGGSPLFFSRQIGLNAGRDVPILGGARLTGKIGRISLGLLNITTDSEPVSHAERTNFTVLRLRRDLLRRSSIGATYTGRSKSLANPTRASQAFGADAGFNLFTDLNAEGFFQWADTPGISASKHSYGGTFGYTPDKYGITVKHLFIDDHFNPEVGFVRRDNLRETTITPRLTHRPKSKRVRRYTLTGTLDYNTNLRRGQLETTDHTVTFDTEFNSSDAINAFINHGYDRLFAPFRIAPGVTVPIGEYSTNTVHGQYTLGPQKRYTAVVGYDYGGLWGGHQHVLSIGSGRLALTPQLAVEPSVQVNWINLPYGSFNTQLYRTRATYMFTPRMYASAFVQYNSTNSTFSTNLRVRWEYQPGSEFFVVYTNDQNMNPLTPNRSSELLTKALVVKFNKLFRF